jgi:hypothetical protein
MATFDYEEMVDIALELIEEFGTVANLMKLDSSPRNPMRPEQGQAGQKYCKTMKNIPMAFVDTGNLGFEMITEEMLKNIDRIAIIAPLYDGIEEMDLLEEGGQSYAVRWMRKLRPANKTVLFIAGVAK